MPSSSTLTLLPVTDEHRTFLGEEPAETYTDKHENMTMQITLVKRVLLCAGAGCGVADCHNLLSHMLCRPMRQAAAQGAAAVL